MIIKLTPAEVKSFVANVLNLSPARFEVEIVNPETAILAAFRQVVKEFPGCRSYEKIPAIKKFRDLVPKGSDGYSSVGLADAKWAVENAYVALKNLEESGRLFG